MDKSMKEEIGAWAWIVLIIASLALRIVFAVAKAMSETAYYVVLMAIEQGVKEREEANQ